MEDNAQQFLDSHESVEDIVIQKISAEKLHMALLRLPKKDQELIYALFYEEKNGTSICRANRRFSKHCS